MIMLIGFTFALIFLIWIVREKKVITHTPKINGQILIITTIQSLILSIQLGVFSWRLFQKVPQKYSELIIGGLGFTNQNKSAELNALSVTIFAFVIIFVFIIVLNDKFPENQTFRNQTKMIAIYGFIPAFIMLGQSLRIPNTNYLLLYSSGMVALTLIVIFILQILYKKNQIQIEEITNVGIKLMLIPLFLVTSELGISLFMTRLGIASYKYGGLTLFMGLAFVIILLLRKGKHVIKENINLGHFISQLGVPFLYSIIFAPPAILKDGSSNIISYKPVLLIVFISLLIVSIIDICKRFVRGNKQILNNIITIVSPWALSAILVFLQSYYIGWPAISPDEYHASEFYSPWWLLNQLGYIPYVDFEPARGLVNYVPGLLAWLFFDNTFAAQSLVTNQFAALYVFMCFFAFRSIVGDFISFLMVGSLFAFIGLPTGGIVIVIASLVILYKSIITSNYINSLWIWLGLSVFSSLLYIAEGSLFVIATSPVAFWLVYKSYRSFKKELGLSIGVLSLATLALLLTTKIGGIFISAGRYLIEQSGVNNLAHGVAWQYPVTDINQMVTSGYFWQIIRFSWILLIIPIVVILIGKPFRNHSKHNQIFLFSLFIICIMLIPKAAGRIDAVAFSRPGQTSVGLIICGLPLVLIPNIKKPSTKALLPLCLALLFGLLGNQEQQLKNVTILPQQSAYEPDFLIDGNGYGFPNLGTNVSIDQVQLQRQLEIKTVLDQILEPQETFYDATNHSLDYGIQGRASPVTVLAPYNIPAESQQRRIVEQLQEKQIPLLLIDAENIYHDGGTLSLRNYIIYDYIVKKFLPFSDEYGRIWMIRHGQEYRLNDTNYNIGVDEDQLILLTKAFWKKDLMGIPSAWGNSISSLSNSISNPRNILHDGRISKIYDVRILDNGNWEITGPDPSISISLPRGLSGDLLYLEFDRAIHQGDFQIFWTTDENPEFSEDQSLVFAATSSKYLIPISSAPSWKQNESAKIIRIDLPDDFTGIFAVQKLIIYDRTTLSN